VPACSRPATSQSPRLWNREYAVRGGIVDVYPMGAPAPYRIDLFGEKIESIRLFDPENQRSGEKLPGVRLLPAREVPLQPEAIQRFRQAFRTRFEGDPQKVALYREVSKARPAGIEYYLPLFFEATASLFDYLPENTLCIIEDGIEETTQIFWQETEERYRILRTDPDGRCCRRRSCFLSPPISLPLSTAMRGCG